MYYIILYELIIIIIYHVNKEHTVLTQAQGDLRDFQIVSKSRTFCILRLEWGHQYVNDVATSIIQEDKVSIHRLVIVVRTHLLVGCTAPSLDRSVDQLLEEG